MANTEKQTLGRLITRYRNWFDDSEFNVGTLFVLPALLLLAIEVVYPLFRTIWLGMHASEGSTYNWVAFQNYITIVNAEWFGTVIVNTVIWTVLGVALQFLLGFIAALLLNTQFKGRTLVRGLLIIPWVTPGIVVAIIFQWMYSPQFGIINRFLAEVGVISEYVAWLSEPSMALYAIIVAISWKGFPFVMVMVLAGLQNVDEQLHRAAIIDGAPRWARFWHVTIPQLTPVLKVTLLLTVIWTFNNFVLIFVMTGGGPVGSTMVLPLKVYKLAFDTFQFGLASALSVFMFAIMSVFMAMYIRALQSKGVEL